MAEKEVRLIDANALGPFVFTSRNPKDSAEIRGARKVINQINAAPTIDPESLRPHGKWLICSDGYYPYCSECKEEPKGGNMTSYCPNCGAIMKEDGKNVYKCKHTDCFYRMGSPSHGDVTQTTHCGYILITGEPRGCPADKCDKYIPREGAIRRYAKRLEDVLEL